MRALVAEIATRLSTVSWTVYEHAVPVSPASRYLWVYSTTGTPYSDVLSDVNRLRAVRVWISAVSLNTNPHAAAEEAAWGAEKAQNRIVDWFPTTGELSWAATDPQSSPPRREDDLPSTVAFVATNSYLYQIQPGS